MRPLLLLLSLLLLPACGPRLPAAPKIVVEKPDAVQAVAQGEDPVIAARRQLAEAFSKVDVAKQDLAAAQEQERRNDQKWIRWALNALTALFSLAFVGAGIAAVYFRSKVFAGFAACAVTGIVLCQVSNWILNHLTGGVVAGITIIGSVIGYLWWRYHKD